LFFADIANPLAHNEGVLFFRSIVLIYFFFEVFMPAMLNPKLTSAESLLLRLLSLIPPSGAVFIKHQWIGGVGVTLYSPKARLAVELDGFEHLDPESCLILAQRRAALHNMGIMELRVSSREVKRDPARVLERICDCVEFRLTRMLSTQPPLLTQIAA
jgi:very-short-patch-repair endonuclease